MACIRIVKYKTSEAGSSEDVQYGMKRLLVFNRQVSYMLDCYKWGPKVHADARDDVKDDVSIPNGSRMKSKSTITDLKRGKMGRLRQRRSPPGSPRFRIIFTSPTDEEAS